MSGYDRAQVPGLVFNSPGALGLVRFRTLILIIRSANHIVKPLTFLELVRILNPSVPCQGLLFLNPPPLFFQSTVFPSGCRIVFRLNYKTPHSFLLALSGQGGAEESIEDNRRKNGVSGESGLMLCALICDFAEVHIFDP